MLSKLSFMSPDRISANLEQVRRLSGVSLQAKWPEVLGALQDFPLALFKTSARHQQILDAHFPAIRPVLAGIMGGELPPSYRSVDSADFSRFSMLAEQAEAEWQLRWPSDFRAYDNLIGWVIYAYRDDYSGGSVSNCIGWIWFSPDSEWTRLNFLENLVHEYTHNVLFLEEMVGTLFSVSAAVMAEPENQVVSAIRKVPRFFDQAYHAAAVALVLAELYVELGDQEKAITFIEGLLPSLDALKEKREVMTDNGRVLLREMIDRALELYDELVAIKQVA